MKKFLSGLIALTLGVGVTVNAYSNNYNKKPMTLKAVCASDYSLVDPDPEH